MFDFSLGFGASEEPKESERELTKQATEPIRKARRSTVLKRRDAHTYRRAFGETQLLDLVYEHTPFKDGESYHFLTGGDVDGLSFLRIILRQQPLDYLMLSTWCMAQEDVFEIRDWLDSGKIKRCDAYVGEIFPGSYTIEYKFLKETIEAHGGKVAVFRNHAKIFAGYGPLFHFGIESSANINTNPRTENACITIGEEIFDFYNDYFSNINSFE